MNDYASKLARVKLVHTIVWVFFVVCIVAIPVLALLGKHVSAAWAIFIVLLEVVILALNSWRCPLTDMAAQYTDDRQANFDIYLPLWVARNNKLIFGTLFLAGTAFAIARWPGV